MLAAIRVHHHAFVVRIRRYPRSTAVLGIDNRYVYRLVHPVRAGGPDTSFPALPSTSTSPASPSSTPQPSPTLTPPHPGTVQNAWFTAPTVPSEPNPQIPVPRRPPMPSAPPRPSQGPGTPPATSPPATQTRDRTRARASRASPSPTTGPTPSPTSIPSLLPTRRLAQRSRPLRRRHCPTTTPTTPSPTLRPARARRRPAPAPAHCRSRAARRPTLTRKVRSHDTTARAPPLALPTVGQRWGFPRWAP